MSGDSCPHLKHEELQREDNLQAFEARYSYGFFFGA